MDITLTPQQKQYIAGMLAGFLDQLELPLAGNHPKAVEAALFQALEGISDDWQKIGWPDRTMLQIAIASGMKSVYDNVAQRLAASSADLLKRIK